MINPHRLVILRAVLAAGSINMAARNLNYSPATISQHMGALAKETGLVLFDKHGRGILATEAARQLAEEADALLADFARLERVVVDLQGGRSRPLAIACFASAAEEWIPEVVRTVRELEPNLTVEVSLNEPVDGRGRRQPDLDIRTEPVNSVGLHLDGFSRQEIAVEDLVVVLPVHHRLAELDAVPLRELADEDWIDHDIYDSPIGQIVRSACRAVGFAPQHAARLDDHRAAVRLVAAGLGVTVLPWLAVAQPIDEVVVRPLVDPVVQRRIVAHARTSRRRADLLARAVARLRVSAADAGISVERPTAGRVLPPPPVADPRHRDRRGVAEGR